MYWVVDILFILALVATMFFCYKGGFLKLITGILKFVFLIVFGLLYIAALLLLLYKLGVVDGFAVLLLNVIGETNLLFELMNITSFDVCQILAFVILFIVCWIISAFAVRYTFKLFEYIVRNVHRKGAFKVVDGIIGLLVGMVVIVGLFLAIQGVSYGIYAASDGKFCEGLHEVFKACKITGFIYDINPLKDLFASIFGA